MTKRDENKHWLVKISNMSHGVIVRLYLTVPASFRTLIFKFLLKIEMLCSFSFFASLILYKHTADKGKKTIVILLLLVCYTISRIGLKWWLRRIGCWYPIKYLLEPIFVDVYPFKTFSLWSKNNNKKNVSSFVAICSIVLCYRADKRTNRQRVKTYLWNKNEKGWIL